MSYPTDIKYTQSHEWIRIGSSHVVLGVSWFAQDSMGDVVHVELPQLGDTINAGEPICEIESVKAVSDVYSPVSGEVIEVNDALEDSPEMVNSAPYGNGWLCKIEVQEGIDLDDFMDASAYKTHCG